MLRSPAALAAAIIALTPAPAAAPSSPVHIPVFRTNFPDPFIVPVGDRFFAYATNEGEANVPMATSRDLVTWRTVKDERGALHDAMPQLPAWAEKGRTWAPEVLEAGGRYLLYFTARHRARDVQCVGVAASADPLGPFQPQGTEPLVCQFDEGGTIDASPFRARNGQLYLHYKNDGNNPRFLKPARIYGQRLSADGLRLEGKAVPLLRNDKHWEWRVVEAPAMVNHGAGYTMLFSGNHFGWEADQVLSNYATAYARCDGPLGPCRDARENPILLSYDSRTAGCLSGPGHPAVFEARGRRWVAFHAWAATSACRKDGNRREMYIAPLGFAPDGKPLIGRSLRPAASR